MPTFGTKSEYKLICKTVTPTHLNFARCFLTCDLCCTISSQYTILLVGWQCQSFSRSTSLVLTEISQQLLDQLTSNVVNSWLAFVVQSEIL